MNNRSDAGRNALGTTYYLDSNAFIDLVKDPSVETPMGFLYTAYLRGWIGICITDTLGVERTKRFGEDLGVHDPSLWFFESMGPMVLGHSRCDSSVFGSVEDDERISDVLAVLHPARSRGSLSENDIRDGMHLATTLRYGARLFVTRDKGILKKTDELATKFELMVLTPKEARAQVEAAIASARAREATREVPGWLPTWPGH